MFAFSAINRRVSIIWDACASDVDSKWYLGIRYHCILIFGDSITRISLDHLQFPKIAFHFQSQLFLDLLILSVFIEKYQRVFIGNQKALLVSLLPDLWAISLEFNLIMQHHSSCNLLLQELNNIVSWAQQLSSFRSYPLF